MQRHAERQHTEREDSTGDRHATSTRRVDNHVAPGERQHHAPSPRASVTNRGYQAKRDTLNTRITQAHELASSVLVAVASATHQRRVVQGRGTASSSSSSAGVNPEANSLAASAAAIGMSTSLTETLRSPGLVHVSMPDAACPVGDDVLTAIRASINDVLSQEPNGNEGIARGVKRLEFAVLDLDPIVGRGGEDGDENEKVKGEGKETNVSVEEERSKVITLTEDGSSFKRSSSTDLVEISGQGSREFGSIQHRQAMYRHNLLKSISRTELHLDKLSARVMNTRSRVLVTGDLNAGKSTFVNAILGRDIVPDDQEPCTALFAEVISATHNGGKEEVHGIKDVSKYDFNDPSTYTRFEFRHLRHIVEENPEMFEEVRIFCKDSRSNRRSLLHNGIVDISLIDSPGLNIDFVKTTALFSQQEEIDVVVFVVNAENHFTMSGVDFLRDVSKEKQHIFIVVNRFDSIRRVERCKEEILKQIKAISPHTYEHADSLVHFVSAREYRRFEVKSTSDESTVDAVESATQENGDKPETGKLNGKNGLVDMVKGEESTSSRGSSVVSESDSTVPFVREFEHLERDLRSFVMENRCKSKLQPAKTFITNLLIDILKLSEYNVQRCTKMNEHQQSLLEEADQALVQFKKTKTQIFEDFDSATDLLSKRCEESSQLTLDEFLENLDFYAMEIEWDGIMYFWRYAYSLRTQLYRKALELVEAVEQEAQNVVSDMINRLEDSYRQSVADHEGLLQTLSHRGSLAGASQIDLPSLDEGDNLSIVSDFIDEYTMSRNGAEFDTDLEAVGEHDLALSNSLVMGPKGRKGGGSLPRDQADASIRALYQFEDATGESISASAKMEIVKAATPSVVMSIGGWIGFKVLTFRANYIQRATPELYQMMRPSHGMDWNAAGRIMFAAVGVVGVGTFLYTLSDLRNIIEYITVNKVRSHLLSFDFANTMARRNADKMRRDLHGRSIQTRAQFENMQAKEERRRRRREQKRKVASHSLDFFKTLSTTVKTLVRSVIEVNLDA